VQRQLARTVLSPAVNANRAVKDWSGMHATPIDRGLLLELEAQIAAVQAGNFDRPIALLAAHAETLSSAFFGLMNSGFEYRGHPYHDDKVRLAMRVNARFIATVQTIRDLKSPSRAAYVEANIGNAVQVNNGTVALTDSQKAPNELLERINGKRLDLGTTSQAFGSDSAMATVGAVHWPQDG
jgi:hypothetical protein